MLVCSPCCDTSPRTQSLQRHRSLLPRSPFVLDTEVLEPERDPGCASSGAARHSPSPAFSSSWPGSVPSCGTSRSSRGATPALSLTPSRHLSPPLTLTPPPAFTGASELAVGPPWIIQGHLPAGGLHSITRAESLRRVKSRVHRFGDEGAGIFEAVRCLPRG